MHNRPGTTHFARLLDRIRAGDPSAKDELIRDAYWRVHRRTHYILRGSFPSAGSIKTDDVVSVSLENFARKLGDEIGCMFDNPAALFGYIDVVIRHVAIDEVRRRRGLQYRTQFPDAQLPADLPETRNGVPGNDVLSRLSFEELIETLPESDQHLINFRYIREMTEDEIATLLGLSRRTVSRQIRIILLKLRAELERLDDGENR
jgi:RNA polymerase sigma factor (sigma-70 family)